ncbi:MAG: glycosyltransferase family 4 protein [Roseivirga sp.]|nr:glycosyltransferase family 4 protein [Roseivirga sp.]
MHVAFVFHSYASPRKPEQLIQDDQTTRIWARALANKGIRLTVIHRFCEDAEISYEGVDYLFLKDNLPYTPRPWYRAIKFNKKVAKIARSRSVDLIHAHNLFSAGTNFTMLRYCDFLPVLIQDHVAVPNLRRWIWHLRLGLRKIDGALFSARGQEQVWVQKKLIKPEKVHFVMETTSPFSCMPREEARQISGLTGGPVFLWVGNLNENKSPLTVLEAFNELIKKHNGAMLYMIYKENLLEGQVRAYIQKKPSLLEKVHLLGAMNQAELMTYYNSADYFVSASYKEGSGYAAIEAMSCGVIPVLSDIPSFQSLTNQGSVGALFTPGNSKSLTRQMLTLMDKPIDRERARTLEHYEKHFSEEALGTNMLEVYESMVADFVK